MPLEPSSNFTQASSWANDWETLFYFEVGIFIFFSVLIFSLILYFAIKYRRRPGNEAAPPTKDHLPLEVTWTVVPAAICVVMFVWGASLFIRNGLPPAGATEISVAGKQWPWKIQYPDGRRDINELHTPVRVSIKLNMASEAAIDDTAVPADHRTLATTGAVLRASAQSHRHTRHRPKPDGRRCLASQTHTHPLSEEAGCLSTDPAAVTATVKPRTSSAVNRPQPVTSTF